MKPSIFAILMALIFSYAAAVEPVSVYKATDKELKVNPTDWAGLNSDQKTEIISVLRLSGLVKPTLVVIPDDSIESAVGKPQFSGAAPEKSGIKQDDSILGIHVHLHVDPVCIVRAAACTAAEVTALGSCGSVGGPPLVAACQAAAGAAYTQCICH